MLNLEIVTPEGQKLTQLVTEVTAPGLVGELGILPGHIPLLTVLDIGPLKYIEDGGDTKSMAVNGGYLQIDGKSLIVITETAELADEIDIDRAQKALERVTADLANLEAGSVAHDRKLRAQKRAQTRLSVSGTSES